VVLGLMGFFEEKFDMVISDINPLPNLSMVLLILVQLPLP
jgi:broad specificity polyphosphatase/5'/3'-nucleotidase SurE